MGYNLPLNTHDEDQFHHPQILKLASGTHRIDFKQRQKTQRNLPESNKQIVTKTKY